MQYPARFVAVNSKSDAKNAPFGERDRDGSTRKPVYDSMLQANMVDDIGYRTSLIPQI